MIPIDSALHGDVIIYNQEKKIFLPMFYLKTKYFG